jgi:hypothetical protein
MRTLSSQLTTALESQSFDAYIKAIIDEGEIWEKTLDVRSYKLTGTELDINVLGSITVSTVTSPRTITLERGVLINGTKYTVKTSKFIVTEGFVHSDNESIITLVETVAKAYLINPIYINFLADGTYEEAIDSFCTAINRTYSLVNPTAAWWGYQFLPNGKSFTSNNAQTFLSLLRQKYFIFCCDNGGDEILFYFAPKATDDTEYGIIPDGDYWIQTGFLPKRRYMSRDENSSINYSGTAGDVIHNLGYLHSTASAPLRKTQNQLLKPYKLPIHLKYQDGDNIDWDENQLFLVPAKFIEIFDPKGKAPNWYVTIEQLEYFSNTEGGPLPSTIERIASYTPIVSLGFDGNLGPEINNLQALAQAVDELVLGDVTTSDIREKLSANRTYYVRTDGSDSNTGLVNSANGAFLTLQKAVDVIALLDINSKIVTVQVANGTYTGGVNFKQVVGWSQQGDLVFLGNTTTPANCLISVTSDDCFYGEGITSGWDIKGFKLLTTISGHGIYGNGKFKIRFYNIDFGATVNAHLRAGNGCEIQAMTNYDISGGAYAHAYAYLYSLIQIRSRTITFKASVTFSYFATTEWPGALIWFDAATFSLGAFSVTGSRYFAYAVGIIWTSGGGANYFPGNSAGSILNAGQYL